MTSSTYEGVAMITSDMQPHLDRVLMKSLTSITVVSCYEWVFTEDIAQHTLYEVPTNVDKPRGDAVRQIRFQLSLRTTMTAHWTNEHLIDMSQFQIVWHVLSYKVRFTTERENATSSKHSNKHKNNLWQWQHGRVNTSFTANDHYFIKILLDNKFNQPGFLPIDIIYYNTINVN